MGVLAGLRVIEFEAIGPVPFAGMLLADMGAEVLRIDRPAPPTDLGVASDSPKVDVLGRGKHSLVLDLKAGHARGEVLRIAERADVLLEGFRPGTMERLGIGPDAMLAARPELVYGRMTGWGQDGPLAHTAGHDINYIARAGLLSTIGEAARKPVPPLNLLGDFGGGGMLLAMGVLAAVLAVRQGGPGQVVDAAMIDGAALLGAGLAGLVASGLWNEGRGCNLLDGGAPWYDTYQTADGGYVAVGAIEARFYRQLLVGLGLDPRELPPRHDRAAWPALREAISRCFRSRTRREWMQVFEGGDACVSPVLSLSEAGEDPQLRARATYLDVAGVRQPAPAPRFGTTPAAGPRTAPGRGVGGEDLIRAWGVPPGASAPFTGADG